MENENNNEIVNSTNGAVADIVFYTDVEYFICSGIELQNASWLEEVQKTKPVPSHKNLGQLKCTNIIEAKKDFIHPENKYIHLAYEDSIIVFTTTKPGRILLINNQLYLLEISFPAQLVIHPITNPMVCLGDFLPPLDDGELLTLEQVQRQLVEAGIKYGVASAEIEGILKKIETTRKAVCQFTLAKGVPPQNGADGKFELFFTPEASGPKLEILPNGKVDFRKNIVIPMAHTGETLAKIFPPSDGKPGIDLYGTVLEASPGTPAQLFSGEGCAFAENNTLIKAVRDGQIAINGEVLTVMPTYQLNGDVDFQSGNIEFDGNIIISGSISSGFTVKAKGDIFVQGNIESAIVNAGRDLVVQGGVIGSAEIPIKIGRDFVAHHLQNAKIEALGNIQILHSALHSQIETSGEFLCSAQKGSLIGGLLITQKNAEIRNLGSDTGTLTRLIMGENFLLRREILDTQKSIELLNSGITKIELYLQPLLNKENRDSFLKTAEQVQRLKKVIEKRQEMVQQLPIYKAKAKRLEMEATIEPTIKLKVLGPLFQNVKLQISGMHWTPDSFMQAIEISYETETGRIKSTSIKGQ